MKISNEDLAERAVIERSGTSDAMPVATATWHWFDDEYGVWSVIGQPVRKGHPGEEVQLYDAAALARARQQGYEAARAEFYPVAKVVEEDDYWSRGHFYKGHRKQAKLLKGFSDLDLGTHLYAARQPTKKATPE